jgi:hypothetical protein
MLSLPKLLLLVTRNLPPFPYTNIRKVFYFS